MEYNKALRLVGACMVLIAAVLVAMILAGCTPSGPIEPQQSPRDLWISAHPTSLDEFGRCVEFDGELCDEDPYDLDDLWELDATKKSSAKPKASIKPKASPRPATTRRR